MNKYRNKSKGRQVFATQQMLNAPHPEPVATAMLTHDDIAKHAHEIYVKKGYQQGQSEQNWLQAERDMKNQDQAGDPAAY